MEQSKIILPIIIISQFFCTSLWFAGNGVVTDLILNFNLEGSALAHLTSAVQFGFIIGTLCFAVFSIADLFSPSKVFFVCACIGAAFNLGVLYDENSLSSLLLLRFFTGFFLAGIYPVGMKIAVDHFEKGLGKSLSFLVGALVLGTALPHFLKNTTAAFSWKFVLLSTSTLACIGGFLILLFVPDGPFRKPGKKVNIVAFSQVFKNREFRLSAFGYFGHMWELYAFWAFTPVILTSFVEKHPQSHLNVSLWSFAIIGVGSISCVIGGYLAQRWGTKQTAFASLLFSCICCLISPLVFTTNSEVFFLSFLLIWGMLVIADSPLFSTMIAKNAPDTIKGTALTIVNCIGYAITIVSIQTINELQSLTDSNAVYSILAIGPLLGLVALRLKNKNSTTGPKQH